MTKKCLRAKHVVFRNERDGIGKEAVERKRIKGVNKARPRISRSRRRKKKKWGEKRQGEGREGKGEREKKGESIQIYKLLCKLLDGIAREREREREREKERHA